MNSDDDLSKAIETIDGGNVLLLLDDPNGRAQLSAWLKELREKRVRDDQHKRAQMMDTLTGFSGLSQEEADRVMAHLDAGGKLEYESGPCRRCKGKRRVVAYVRGGCFGHEEFEEDCPTCGGMGTDTMRIKLPEV